MVFKRISILTGHYGSGKTNLAVNFALDLAGQGKPVTLVDLDIVSPYFRSADFRELLESRGVRVIAPHYANTNLDIPALPAEIQSVFHQTDRMVILDVGGDDAGAIALGQFAPQIRQEDYDLFYVVNERRYLTRDVESALEVLREIEACSRLKATALINNTNLGEETTPELVVSSQGFAEEAAHKAGTPLALTAAKRELAVPDAYPVEIYVRTAWA